MLKSVICYSMALKVKDVESEIKGETHDRQGGRGVERGKGRERRRKSSQGLARFIGVPRSWRPPDRILIFLARSGKNLFRYSTWAHQLYIVIIVKQYAWL